jgi:CubicO group peptidase (beta-lactamase class C family)
VPYKAARKTEKVLKLPNAAFYLSIAVLALGVGSDSKAQSIPRQAAIDGIVANQMALTGTKGMAIAVVERGKVVRIAAYGDRNAKGETLGLNTVMYGASLTKAVFAATVLQLVAENKLALDTPIARYLTKPLPEYYDAEIDDLYADYRGLASDERWLKITPRMLLTHSAGFANFGFLEPDGKLKIHFEPGTRYAYSGDGLILLQFVLERGLGLDVGQEMQRRVFDKLGMKRTSMMWRPDFATDLADGWTLDGNVEPHDERSATRAAGSMDTTISDFAKFAASLTPTSLMPAALVEEMVRPQLPITTRGQFPTLQPELPKEMQRADLAAGLGVVTFEGPQGGGYFKGGHNDSTANTWVCVRAKQRCVAILSNDVRAEAAFPPLVRFILGETGVPWNWEYGPEIGSK